MNIKCKPTPQKVPASMPVTSLIVLLLFLHLNSWVVPSITRGEHRIKPASSNWVFLNKLTIWKFIEKIKDISILQYKPKHLEHRGILQPLMIKHLSGIWWQIHLGIFILRLSYYLEYEDYNCSTYATPHNPSSTLH